jgi:hypothetical protein
MSGTQNNLREHTLGVAWRNYVIHMVQSLPMLNEAIESVKQSMKDEADNLWRLTEKPDSERSNFQTFWWYMRNESQCPGSHLHHLLIEAIKTAALEEGVPREDVVEILGKRA